MNYPLLPADVFNRPMSGVGYTNYGAVGLANPPSIRATAPSTDNFVQYNSTLPGFAGFAAGTGGATITNFDMLANNAYTVATYANPAALLSGVNQTTGVVSGAPVAANHFTLEGAMTLQYLGTTANQLVVWLSTTPFLTVPAPLTVEPGISGKKVVIQFAAAVAALQPFPLALSLTTPAPYTGPLFLNVLTTVTALHAVAFQGWGWASDTTGNLGAALSSVAVTRTAAAVPLPACKVQASVVRRAPDA